MASPAVVNTNITQISTPNTGFNMFLPATIVAGRTLLAHVRVSTRDAATLGFPAGWTIFSDTIIDSATARTVWAWKKATGSEGATIPVTNGADPFTSSRYVALAWQISGAIDPTVQAPEVSTPATGTSTSANATAVVPTGGSKEYLFLIGVGTPSASSSTVPTNYGGRITASEGTAQSIHGCHRQATTASEDPAAWTISPSAAWVATVVAVHPAAAVPGQPWGYYARQMGA